MKSIIVIAIAILLMAIPASAFDQTYVFTQDDFDLKSGTGIEADFTVSFYPSPDGHDFFIDFYSPELYIEGYYTISISPDPNIDIILHNIQVMNSFNSNTIMEGNSLLFYSPHFKNNEPVYIKIYMSLSHFDTENHTSSQGTYLLQETCTLGSNFLTEPNPQKPSIPADGYIVPSSPIIESLSIEQYHFNNRYNEKHVFHFTFSDLNGHDDITSFRLQMEDLDIPPSLYYEFYNRTITPSITSINDTHASATFGIVELAPGNNYSINLTLTDSTSLSTTKTLFYTPKNWDEPVSIPPFTIEPIYFAHEQAGSNSLASLTIHNNNAPPVKVTSLIFKDFIIYSGAGLVGELQAINLKFSIPTTTLCEGESLTIPLTLYIPPGTKSGYISSFGRITLTEEVC